MYIYSWMDKDDRVCVCVCVCVMEYYSAIKKNEIMPFAATGMDLKIIILSEVKPDKDKYIIQLIGRIWKKKTMQMNLYTKQK